MAAFDDWRHAKAGKQVRAKTGPNRITPRKLNTMLQKHSPCIPAVTNDSKEGLMYMLTDCAASNDACLAKCAKLLQDHDVPIMPSSSAPFTPLHAACARGLPKLLQVLLTKPESPALAARVMSEDVYIGKPKNHGSQAVVKVNGTAAYVAAQAAQLSQHASVVRGARKCYTMLTGLVLPRMP